MCHVEAHVEIRDCDLLFAVLLPCRFEVCAHHPSSECRRVFRLVFQHFCEELGVLAVERPVGRRCRFIPGDVRGWQCWVDKIS